MTTRTGRGLVIALLAALLHVVALGAPAQADPDRLRLSLSQSGPFTETLSTPLFSGSYVPGTATSTFYVQNDSPSTTRATISVVPKADSNDFERALSFSASVGGVFGEGVPLFVDKKKNQCRTIVTGPTIQPGGVQEVDVTMRIDPDFPQPVTQQTASFSFVVTLSQVTNKGKVDVCGTQSPGGQSVQVLGADTASTKPAADGLTPASSGAGRSSGFVAGLTALMLGAGALLLVASRRRRRQEPAPDAG